MLERKRTLNVCVITYSRMRVCIYVCIYNVLLTSNEMYIYALIRALKMNSLTRLTEEIIKSKELFVTFCM